MAVDDDGNIYVADGCNHRIQKFTPDGNLITAVGRKGREELQFNFPIGGTIHPLNMKMYVADHNNNRIHILNPDLTFSSSFGSYGGVNGQFDHPIDVAFDSTGNVYVADHHNNRIQVLQQKESLSGSWDNVAVVMESYTPLLVSALAAIMWCM